MRFEWPLRPLSDVAREITVGFVGTMADQYVDDGVPFLRSLNVRPLRIDTNDVKYISREFHDRLRKSALRPGDVVIVRTGKPGTCAVIPETLPEANCSDVVIVRCAQELRPAFLAYWVNAMAASHVSAHTVGAVQQHFNVASAKLLRLPVPALPVQDTVLAPLMAMDRRIDLLRQTNATLESIAQALFKSWFIDFDPVHAKAEGREPVGMDSATAALFPSEFEESALGLIPRGWRASKVGDVFRITMGQSPPGETYNETGAGLPFYQGRADFGFRFPDVRVYCTAPTRHARAGDVLVSVRAPVGDVNVALEACAIGRGVAAVGLDGAPSFALYSMKALRDRFAEYESHGTVFGSINKKQFEALPCVIPSAEVLAAFAYTAAVLDDRVRVNEHQIRSLTQVRDSLLPRLISGKLRLPEAQQRFEDALA